jgi:predicted Zn-dependent peptidase
MSSRLYQTIREERGLAYSVYSYPVSYADCGTLVVYAGMSPDNLGEVHRIVQHELDRLVEEGITESELRVAKGYLEGSLVLGVEDSGGAMSRIGKAALLYGHVLEVDDVLDHFRAITLADVQRAIERVLGPAAGPRVDRTVAVVGPLSRRQVEATLSA